MLIMQALSLGETTYRIREAPTSSSEHPRDMRYATTMVALRLTPRMQCTSTPPRRANDAVVAGDAVVVGAAVVDGAAVVESFAVVAGAAVVEAHVAPGCMGGNGSANKAPVEVSHAEVGAAAFASSLGVGLEPLVHVWLDLVFVVPEGGAGR